MIRRPALVPASTRSRPAGDFLNLFGAGECPSELTASSMPPSRRFHLSLVREARGIRVRTPLYFMRLNSSVLDHYAPQNVFASRSTGAGAVRRGVGAMIPHDDPRRPPAQRRGLLSSYSMTAAPPNRPTMFVRRPHARASTTQRSPNPQSARPAELAEQGARNFPCRRGQHCEAWRCIRI